MSKTLSVHGKEYPIREFRFMARTETAICVSEEDVLGVYEAMAVARKLMGATAAPVQEKERGRSMFLLLPGQAVGISSRTTLGYNGLAEVLENAKGTLLFTFYQRDLSRSGYWVKILAGSCRAQVTGSVAYSVYTSVPYIPIRKYSEAEKKLLRVVGGSLRSGTVSDVLSGAMLKALESVAETDPTLEKIMAK